MSNVDQFESVFRSAVKDLFEYENIEFDTALVITDLSQNEADAFAVRARNFINENLGENWKAIAGDQYKTTADLLALIERESPGLIVTYRNLHSEAWQHPHSLGEHLDVLIQKTSAPVLVLPHPKANYAAEGALDGTKVVMAVTNHLLNDHRLVNFAAHFTQPKGNLILVHIENDAAFERVMDAISRIPTIDTDDAREKLAAQLLKEPPEFISSCRDGLTKSGMDIQVDEVIEFGHHLKRHRELIEQHKVDLLVMNTKDEDQLAMHGLAYPLAVELRHVSLLML